MRVQRVYIRQHGEPLRRGLRCARGLVYVPGWGGWSRAHNVGVVALPGWCDHAPHELWDGWWTTNWRVPSWAWLYSGPRKKTNTSNPWR